MTVDLPAPSLPLHAIMIIITIIIIMIITISTIIKITTYCYHYTITIIGAIIIIMYTNSWSSLPPPSLSLSKP